MAPLVADSRHRTEGKILRAPATLLRRIESMAVRHVEQRWAAVPPELARRSDPKWIRAGDGIATMMRVSDSLQLNRVVGLGHRGGASEAVIDSTIEAYRSQGVKRFGVELCQGPQTARIARWLEGRGFVRHGGHLLLVRDLRTSIAPLPAEPRVVRVGRRHRSTAMTILLAVFPIPPSRRAWAETDLDVPGFESYLALVEGTPAGVGWLIAEGGLAWLGGGGTLTRWRRHGVHSALIAARLRRAVSIGCR